MPVADPRSLEAHVLDLGLRAELHLAESGDFMLHAWTDRKCVVIERRGDEWGVTPQLEADAGFNSGHPLVFDSEDDAARAFLDALSAVP